MLFRITVLLLLLPAAASAQQAPPDVRTSISQSLADVSNGVLDAAIDLEHPAISVLRVAPGGNDVYLPNLFTPDSNGVRGIVTHIGPGVLDSPSSYHSNTTAHAAAYGAKGSSGVQVNEITDCDPGGGNAIARETWFLTLTPGDSTGVIWDRTVRFLQDVDMRYSSLDGGDTGAPAWVDTVTLARSEKDLTPADFTPLITQFQGDVPASQYTSLAGPLPGGQVLQDGQIIANALRGLHHAGEEVHLRYRIQVIDTRSWFSGLPAADRRATLHALWYGQISKWWRGNVVLPGFQSLDATSREARWLSLDASLPLAASLWAPHRTMGGDLLWWAAYDQWAILGQQIEGTSLGVDEPQPGFMALRVTDLSVPLPTAGFRGDPQPSTPTLPIDVERLYGFTKNREQLARLMPRLRLAHRWIEAHPDPLFYGGASLQALSRLYRQVGDTSGAARATDELAQWKQKLAGLWNPAWLAAQDYRELAAMADYGLLTAPQESDLHALIEKFKESEIPPASRHLSQPRGPGDYTTGLFAAVFRAQMGDADRAHQMAVSVVDRITADPREPFAGFDAAGKPSGASGYGAGAAVIGMYAWGLFGFQPSTESNEFSLQPAIPTAWEGKPAAYTYEYALGPGLPGTTVSVSYTLKGRDLDTVIAIGGLKPGAAQAQITAGDKTTTVDGVLRGQEFLFHLTLLNGGAYRFHIVAPDTVTNPVPEYNTIQLAAPGEGTSLATGQKVSTLEGVLDDAAEVSQAGINWDAAVPPGSLLLSYLSNNGGVTWDRVTDGEWHAFRQAGKGLRYRVTLLRGSDEDIRLRSLTVTFAAPGASNTNAPAGAALPAEMPVIPAGDDPAFLETFDTGLDSAGEHDGAMRVYRDTRGAILGPGSLLVVSQAGEGYGSAWLAHNLSYDPAQYPYLDFWIRTHSNSYAAIWVELGDPGLTRTGLAYHLPDGKEVTPLLVLTAAGDPPDNLRTLGDALVFPDGHAFHVRFNLGEALKTLFGPGPHTVTGLRLVNYVDLSGGAWRFDNLSARTTPLPGVP